MKKEKESTPRILVDPGSVFVLLSTGTVGVGHSGPGPASGCSSWSPSFLSLIPRLPPHLLNGRLL